MGSSEDFDSEVFGNLAVKDEECYSDWWQGPLKRAHNILMDTVKSTSFSSALHVKLLCSRLHNKVRRPAKHFARCSKRGKLHCWHQCDGGV